jgi:hypothetical protein
MFERPPAQGPGTPGFQVVSDPTLRPFEAPGRPAGFSTSLPIDFQGNGRPDLLACYGVFLSDLKLPCRVLRPQPDGSVTDITRQMFGTGALSGLNNPREIVTGDFNGDGRADVFIAAHGYDATPFPGETNVVLISNTDGTYTDRSSTLPQTPDFSHSACVGDIDGDGRLDIFVGNVFGQLRVGPYFLVGRGDGTFTQKTNSLPQQIRNLQEKFLSCSLVDVDRDGPLDLILGTHGDNGFVDHIVLFNDGTGDFTRRPRYVLPPWPQPATLDIVALDINRDGWPDVMMLTSRTDSAAGSGLQVLINQRNGTFADETVTRLGRSSLVPGGSYCSFFRLADFNGDGWEDFYCNDGPMTVPNRYWISNGDGTWSPGSPGVLPEGSGTGIHAVDFDGDGRPDLLSVARTMTGDVAYNSYFNRTPRAAVTSNVTFPPRNETNDFNVQLENLYRDRLGARPISAYVDLEGANVWLTEYARYRVGLCTHADAMTRVFWQILAGVVSGACGLTPAGAIPFPPRTEGLDFMNQLESVYRDRLRRTASSVYVDNEGRVVWILEYLRYRLNGCGHGDATTRVFQQILGQGIQPICR